MDGVCKELDKVKEELEKLKEECKIKTQLCQSLKQAHDDQLVKIQEAKLRIEKQAQELNTKSEEIAEAKQLYEDIKSKLQQTESSLKHVSLANEKLRSDWSDSMQKLEGEHRKLVSALDEATVRNADLEKKLCASVEEIEILRSQLSDSQKKVLEAEEKAHAAKELRLRDDAIQRLEEQSLNIQDQLKWKKEQFEHLEEAHKRLQDQFQSSKEEWAKDKSALLEEISSLQISLDTQTRINESLHTQLKMCNQALACEETRRKGLEVQLSESKLCFENVVAECQEAKLKIESLTVERDEEIADLRSLLGMKETLVREMEYKLSHLDQENKELLGSVKELQEAQINKRKADPSLTKLRNKLKDLEQVHSTCPVTLKEREAEWKSKMEKTIEAMSSYESDLKWQNEHIHQLQMQLESCHSSLEVSGEEISILLMVMKSELLEAYSRLLDSKSEACNKEGKEKIRLPAEQMELEHDSPVKAHIYLQQAREEIASLAQKLESFKSLEEQSAVLENELEKHKKMLEESSICQLQLREQVMLMEAKLKDVSSALEKSNSELAVKICEASQTEIELEIWKSKAHSMRTLLEQNQAAFCQMESSFLAQVETEESLREENRHLLRRLEDQYQKLDYLQQQIALLDQELVSKEKSIEAMKLEAEEACKEKEHYFQVIAERDITVENLRKEKTNLGQESTRRESAAAKLARSEAEKIFMGEKEKLQMIAAEKNKGIGDLQMLALSLEQNLTDEVICSFSESVEKSVEIDALRKALGKAEYLKNLEVQEKNCVIRELQKEVADLQSKLLLHSEQEAKKNEALLEYKQLEMEKLKDKFENEQANWNKLVNQLDLKKAAMLENINVLSLERENLLVYFEGICEQIGNFVGQDLKLMGMLDLMTKNSIENDGLMLDITMGDKLHDPTNVSCTTKEVKGTIGGRSPLRELNHQGDVM